MHATTSRVDAQRRKGQFSREATYKYCLKKTYTLSDKKSTNIPTNTQNEVNIVQKLIQYILTFILLMCSVAYIIPAFGI